jgi:hypothetical protein
MLQVLQQVAQQLVLGEELALQQVQEGESALLLAQELQVPLLHLRQH